MGTFGLTSQWDVSRSPRHHVLRYCHPPTGLFDLPRLTGILSRVFQGTCGDSGTRCNVGSCPSQCAVQLDDDAYAEALRIFPWGCWKLGTLNADAVCLKSRVGIGKEASATPELPGAETWRTMDNEMWRTRVARCHAAHSLHVLSFLSPHCSPSDLRGNQWRKRPPWRNFRTRRRRPW